MGFKKGEPRPKNAGRKKGTPNKVTADMREKMQYVFNKLHDEIDTIIDGLTENEKSKLYLGIAEYILPKLQRTTIDTPNEDGGLIIKVIKGVEKPKEE